MPYDMENPSGQFGSAVQAVPMVRNNLYFFEKKPMQQWGKMLENSFYFSMIAYIPDICG